MDSPLLDSGDLFRAILCKWSKIVGWGVSWNEHIWDRDVGQKSAQWKEDTSESLKTASTVRENASSSSCYCWAQASLAAQGHWVIKRKSKISCLWEESISVYQHVTQQATGNTRRTPMVGCQVLSRFYLLQDTRLKFKKRTVVPPAPSTPHKENYRKYFSSIKAQSELEVLFTRGRRHIQHFAIYVKRQVPFLQ